MPDSNYRSHWASCDDCEVSVIVERDDARGLPEHHEWESEPYCPLCGSSLFFGSADEMTVSNSSWKKGFAAGRAVSA